MKRSKILLSLPANFAVRSFLFTDVLRLLRRNAEVAILSPFCSEPEFKERFEGDGVTCYPTVRYGNHEGAHAVWVERVTRACRRKWGLFSPDHSGRVAHFAKASTDISQHRVSASPARRLVGRAMATELGISLLRRVENTTFTRSQANAPCRRYRALLEEIAPDTVVGTLPFHVETYPLWKAVDMQGMRRILYVLSFDNITSRPPLPVAFHRYLVWNDSNRRELLRQYPKVREDQIEVCGPLSFDWYRPGGVHLLPRAEWLRSNGLDASKPVLLFGTCVERFGPMEPAILTNLLRANRAGRFPQEVQFLVRLHPNDRLDRWRLVQSEFPNVPFVLSMSGRSANGASLPLEEDGRTLVSDLTHCAAVITTGSSVALDACRLDKPAVYIGFDPRPGGPFDQLARQIYKREHLRPIVDMGGVRVAHSQTELEDLISEHLTDPAKDRRARRHTASYYDPFMDGRAAERVADAVLRFAGAAQAGVVGRSHRG